MGTSSKNAAEPLLPVIIQHPNITAPLEFPKFIILLLFGIFL
jgi:hypothetical protein